MAEPHTAPTAEPDEPNRRTTTSVTATPGDNAHPIGHLPGVPGLEGLSVWATAQATGPVQRRGRYVRESVQHPARMLPAIAAHAVHAYTQPGDLVLDPMCGIGTTLIEAIHAGRDAIGIEYESRWSDIADANIGHAHAQGATGRAGVIRGDATGILLSSAS